MAWNIVAVIIVIGIVGYIFVLPRLTADKNDYNPETSFKLVKNGAVLIDARSKEEFDSGHIEGAVNIPHSIIHKQEDLIKKLTNNDKTKPIVVYCQSGNRSGIAKKELQTQGFTHVTNHGGIGSWKTSDIQGDDK